MMSLWWDVAVSCDVVVHLELVLESELVLELGHMDADHPEPADIKYDIGAFSNFWILPVFSLELVCHIHQRGGTRLRNSGKNMTFPCYQFYNVKEMGPEGEYDCKKCKCLHLL